MHEPLIDIIEVRALEDHKLRLRFEDGTEGEVNVARVVPFEGVFAQLRDLSYFRRVRLDPEAGTICWPNQADIDPGVLYQALDAREHHPERALRREPPEATAPGTETRVPEICRFFGVIIRMYFSDSHDPHFHADYAEKSAVFEIETLAVVEGRLPPRIRGFVAEWAQLHQPELRENWERARRGEPLRRIAPLE